MTQASGWSPEPVDPDSPEAREPLSDLLRRLASDGKAYAQAESARIKVRGRFYAVNARDVAICAALALFLLHALVVALLVGLVIALVPMVGIWAAIAIMAAGTLAVMAVVALVAANRINRLKGK